MFLTVTPNASLDRILFIRRFQQKTTMRVHKSVDAVGGKGFDVSVALRCLGQETTAVGFKAGKIGGVLAEMLTAHGIQLDLVEVPGETRIAHVIIEEDLHQHSHVTTQGYSVTRIAYACLLERFQSQLPGADWVAASGSLPHGVPTDIYQTVTRLAHEKQKSVLLDVSGIPAELAIAARPEILKMNQQEYQDTFARPGEPIEQLARSAEEIVRAKDLCSLIITCGTDGILAATPQGTFLSCGPELEEVNAAGAGDAVSAALMWRLNLGDDWCEALRWAAAAGSATVLTEATAECDWPKVQELYSLIRQEQV